MQNFHTKKKVTNTFVLPSWPGFKVQGSSIKPYKGHDSTCTTRRESNIQTWHIAEVFSTEFTVQRMVAIGNTHQKAFSPRTAAFHKVSLSTDTGANLMAQHYRA